MWQAGLLHMRLGVGLLAACSSICPPHPPFALCASPRPCNLQGKRELDSVGSTKHARLCSFGTSVEGEIVHHPAAILWPRLNFASASTKVHDVHFISPMHLSSLQVSRAVRRATVTDSIDTGSLWPSQLLSALQQRGYIASAGASERPPAFVFDIDGVLIRGSRVLEPAKKALARLYENGGTGFLLCNGQSFPADTPAVISQYLIRPSSWSDDYSV